MTDLNTAFSARDFVAVRGRAKVLLLGTFHFREFADEMLSENRQKEVQEVVDLLAEFAPTKVMVEVRPEREQEVNRQYREYLEGAFSLPANEIHQLGFRIARMMGHDRVHPVDELGRQYDAWDHLFEYGRKRLGLPEGPLSEKDKEVIWRRLHDTEATDRFFALYRHDTALRQRQSLRKHLIYENSAERILVGHGHYLAWLRENEPGDYTMPDHISGWWYDRNLRIFANIRRITEVPGDRVLVIYGYGHLPILRHCFQASYEYDLLEVAQFLA